MDNFCRLSENAFLFGCVEYWLNRYQTLLVGLIALALACFQVWIAHRQAEISSRQTKIMEGEALREEKRSNNDLLDEKFDAAIELLASLLLNHDRGFQFFYGDVEYYGFSLDRYRQDSDRRVIIAAGQLLHDAITEAGHTPWISPPVTARYPHDFLKIHRGMMNALGTFYKLDAPGRDLNEPLELARLKKHMDDIINRDFQMLEIISNAHVRDVRTIPGALS